jgi:glutamyl-tRNA reductase
MTLLVVGASHHTAALDLVERLYLAPDEVPGTLRRLVSRAGVNEAVVLSTCNRVEVYVAGTGFHAGLAEISAVLAERAGCTVTELAAQLVAYHDDDAVAHAMRVAAGLDSMVVGEPQILGQLRDAYSTATEHDTAGPLLHELMQQSLRVGKRVHAETGIDRAGPHLVGAAISAATAIRGQVDRALVIGAGAMGSLAVATLARSGTGTILVANRGAERALRLADAYGAQPVELADVDGYLADVELVVCATAAGIVLTADLVRASRQATPGRLAGAGLLTVLDLAVPRAVEPGVAGLPGVELIDLARLGELLADQPAGRDHRAAEEVVAAEEIVAAEVDAYRTWLRRNEVAPTVAALRARADEVVAAELRRLASRRPDLTDDQRAEVARTAHRIVQQLLHPPTVRVRQLAAMPDGDRYAAALRDLFDLRVAVQMHDGSSGVGSADVGSSGVGSSGVGSVEALPDRGGG